MRKRCGIRNLRFRRFYQTDVPSQMQAWVRPYDNRFQPDVQQFGFARDNLVRVLEPDVNCYTDQYDISLYRGQPIYPRKHKGGIGGKGDGLTIERTSTTIWQSIFTSAAGPQAILAVPRNENRVALMIPNNTAQTFYVEFHSPQQRGGVGVVAGGTYPGGAILPPNTVFTTDAFCPVDDIYLNLLTYTGVLPQAVVYAYEHIPLQVTQE